MPWFKIDDGFHGHPKVVELSLAAVGIWTLSGSWCAKYLTDGMITLRAIQRMGGDEALALELVERGLWLEVDNNFMFKDWADYQPLKVAVEAERTAARDRMATIRSQKKGVRPNTSRTGDERSDEQTQNFEESAPDVLIAPSQSQSLSQSLEKQVQDKPALKYSEEFEQWWERYPRHQGKADAARAFKAARKTTELKTLLDGAQAYMLLQIGVEKTLLKMPAGWLRDRRWEDDPIPAHIPEAKQSPADRAFNVIEMGRAMDNRQLAAPPHHPTETQYRSSMCSEPGHEEYPLAGGCEACKRRVGLAAGVAF